MSATVPKVAVDVPPLIPKRTVSPPAFITLLKSSLAVRVMLVAVPLAMVDELTATRLLVSESAAGLTVIVGSGNFVIGEPPTKAPIDRAVPLVEAVNVAE